MYNITEFRGRRKPTPKYCTASKRLFFTIYYKVADNAFKHAARTWKSHITTQESFIASQDYFFEKEIKSEGDFKKAWGMLYHLSTRSGYQVHVGNLLTHASKQVNNQDGLEFQSNESVPEEYTLGNDGTLKKEEIKKLQRLPWGPHGYLILCGCNTGMQTKRTWSPASILAKSQGVPTLGQIGYAYFSKKWGNYEEKSISDTKFCLWAYERRKNGLFGSGKRVRGKIFLP